MTKRMKSDTALYGGVVAAPPADTRVYGASNEQGAEAWPPLAISRQEMGPLIVHVASGLDFAEIPYGVSDEGGRPLNIVYVGPWHQHVEKGGAAKDRSDKLS